MITTGEWLTPTRASGIAAYGLAVISCSVAWVRARGMRTGSQPAALLTVIESSLLLDMMFDGRWKLHQIFMNLALRWNEYAVRETPQLIVVAILTGLLVFGVLFALRLFRARPGALLAISGVLLSLFIWCIEVVSLHGVDAILYYPLGKAMIVSLVWALGCLLTSVGILVDSRQAKARLENRR
jgi:hypothetical protein